MEDTTTLQFDFEGIHWISKLQHYKSILKVYPENLNPSQRTLQFDSEGIPRNLKSVTEYTTTQQVDAEGVSWKAKSVKEDTITLQHYNTKTLKNYKLILKFNIFTEDTLHYTTLYK